MHEHLYSWPADGAFYSRQPLMLRLNRVQHLGAHDDPSLVDVRGSKLSRLCPGRQLQKRLARRT